MCIRDRRHIRLCYDDDKGVALSAIKLLERNVGITPSHTPIKFVQNIQNQQNNIISNQEIPDLQDYLAFKMSLPNPTPVIDTDTEDDEGDKELDSSE